MGRRIAEEIVKLREAAKNVARLLEYGEQRSRDELDIVGSVAGTSRARLQYSSPRGDAGVA